MAIDDQMNASQLTTTDRLSPQVAAALANPDPVFQARLDLLAALRWAQLEGLSEGVCNHFSVLVPGTTDRFLLNPQGLHWSELTLKDLLVVDPEGNLVEGEHPVEPSAFFIHSRIHLSCPNAICVMHTHMPYTTAISCSEGGTVEWCSQNALRYYDRIAYDRTYNGLAFDAAEGDRLAAMMAGRDILMMANHGVVVSGPSVAEAFDDLYYLERACMIQVLAQSTGKSLLVIPDAICAETQQQIADENQQAGLHMEAIKRILLSRHPEILES
jgi:ribulose-5-phosphate 4-epimerase/fuculose-1-phosphate aldolase